MSEPGADRSIRGMAFWEDVLAERDDLADEYEADGWEALRLRPADVTPLEGEYDDRVGLSILLPDDEYEALAGLLGRIEIDGYQVYRTVTGGYVALLVVVEGVEDVAVFCPAYYALADDSVEGCFEQARTDGHLKLYLRRLSGEHVEIDLDEPDLLAPPETED